MQASRCALITLAAVACTVMPAALGDAFADGIDASMPRTIIVGAPRGHAPSERINARRSGRSASKLPVPAVERWRRHLGGNIDVPPVVDESGRVWTALTIPEVVVVGADGKETTRIRIGASSAVAPPVITSDGTVVVVTTNGAAIGISREGRIKFATPLGLRGRDLDAAPLARSDGSVVFGGRAFVELDASGAVRARATMPERAVGGLLDGPDGALATTDSGAVYVFRPPNAPRRIGTFGGPVRRGAVLEGKRTLLAIVGGKSLVGLDVPTGLTHTRIGDVGLGSFDEPVALHPRGFTIVTFASGLLFGVDSAGNEKMRAILDKGSTDQIPAAFFGTGDARPSPPVVVDEAGHVAFVRHSGRVGIVRPDGTVAITSERLCNNPIGLQPAGDRKLVVACRDGTIWMLGSS
ncbi:MAG: hypothetical protein IPM54_00395 [Polyangiaceae bacterium]|nr:hypothetical protein [Polyangiaceae bacterium]